MTIHRPSVVQAPMSAATDVGIVCGVDCLGLIRFRDRGRANRPIAPVLAVVAFVAGCSLSACQPTVSNDSSPSISTGPHATDALASPSATPRPTIAPPTALPSGVPSYTPRAIAIIERGRQERGSALVLDLEWVGDWGDKMQAYVVLPAGQGPFPGVVFLHWLGNDGTSTRKEFLEEGVALANDGVASMHVQGRFPWMSGPKGVDADRASLIGQVVDLRRAIDMFASRPDVDASKLGIVGHDFGAMYASVLAGLDGRLSTAVLAAGAPHWGDWFLRYWNPLGAISESDYRARLADIDPVALASRIGPRPVLLQWASGDPFVDATFQSEFKRAIGASAVVETYDAGHKLDVEKARADRRGWLLEQFALSPTQSP